MGWAGETGGRGCDAMPEVGVTLARGRADAPHALPPWRCRGALISACVGRISAVIALGPVTGVSGGYGIRLAWSVARIARHRAWRQRGRAGVALLLASPFPLYIERH